MNHAAVGKHNVSAARLVADVQLVQEPLCAPQLLLGLVVRVNEDAALHLFAVGVVARSPQHVIKQNGRRSANLAHLQEVVVLVLRQSHPHLVLLKVGLPSPQHTSAVVHNLHFASQLVNDARAQVE